MTDSMHYATPEDIRADLAGATKPTVHELQDGYPFSLLSDRQFECLLHSIFSEHAAQKNHRYGDFDTAVLMQGVSERGRDCALLKDGVHVGVIQCKRYESLITMPDAVREIIKFCLHALADPRLMPDPETFTYIFAASKDFNEPAKSFFLSVSTSLDESNMLAGWIGEVVSQYKAFKNIDPAQVLGEIDALLRKITIRLIGFNELNTLMIGHTDIQDRYFSVRKVVDNAEVQKLENTINNLTMTLMGKDVRRVLDVLGAVPEDRRIDMGILSMWGYPEAFIQKLVKSNDFKGILFSLMDGKNKLDLQFTDFVVERVHSEIQAHITARRQFSPITISGAAPYLVGRLLMRWHRIQQGEVLATIASPRTETDALSVRKRILDSGRDFLKDDWSGYVGEGELLELKKDLARHVYGRYASTEQMAQTYDSEWTTMSPILDAIERRIEKDFPASTTVVLGQTTWFDDEVRVREIFDAMAKLAKPPPT
ncbi:hypothetical protein FHW69_001843 [Luteibacter sp. Sphag1AF]|uniref:hypothetical protein n=1 Tax=Luteibacter sp. Sphag1AF TaxID=2587031 RepID=UPI00160E27EC|nr:hypothetical protein [Luteibacter sp. Sphag1AF]MBB3227242.1 hypothetical protein [Luteibacter sp. Sphag1AF]